MQNAEGGAADAQAKQNIAQLSEDGLVSKEPVLEKNIANNSALVKPGKENKAPVTTKPAQVNTTEVNGGSSACSKDSHLAC